MAAEVSVMQGTGVRQNYLANVVAGVACFLLEAGWYSYFMNTWLNGIGRTKEWLVSSGMNPAIQYATAVVMAVLMATAISYFTQLTGPADGVARNQDGRAAVGGLHVHCVVDRVYLRGATSEPVGGQYGVLAAGDDADGGDCGRVEEEG